MNIVWTVATAVSLAVLLFVAPDKSLSVFIDGAETAVGFGVKLIAVYCVWLGIFEIADRCNAVQKLAKLLAPINRLLYGKIEAEAANYIALNEASNLLGVGNALEIVGNRSYQAAGTRRNAESGRCGVVCGKRKRCATCADDRHRTACAGRLRFAIGHTFAHVYFHRADGGSRDCACVPCLPET